MPPRLPVGERPAAIAAWERSLDDRVGAGWIAPETAEARRAAFAALDSRIFGTRPR